MNKTLAQQSSVFLIVLLIVLGMINSYSGNIHGFYSNLYQFYFDQFDFTNDIYLRNTLAFKSSFLYDFLKLIRLNLDNDVSGLFLTSIFGLCSANIVYRIGVDFFNLEKQDALIIVLMLGSGIFIIREVRSAIFFTHTGTPSQYCHYLMFFLAYFTLRKKIIISSLIATIMVGLTLKVAWLPICISVLAGFCNWKTRKKMFWYIVPMALVLYMANKTKLDGDHLEIYKFILNRDGSEDSPSLQSFVTNTLFIVSFFFSWLLVRLLDNSFFKTYLKILIVFSFVVYIFGWIYTSLLFKVYPLPSLLLLSPVRSMALYSFFAVFVIYSTIIKKATTSSKYLILLFVYTLIVVPRMLKFSVLMILFLALIIHFFMRHNKNMNYLLKKFSLIVLVIFFSLITLKRTYETVYEFNLLAFKKLNKWTIEKMSDEVFEDLYALRGCPDFVFLYVEYNRSGNFISGKSNFAGDGAHFYLNVPLQLIAKNREDVVRSIKDKLVHASALSSYEIEALRSTHAVLLYPIHQENIFKYGSDSTTVISKNYLISTYGLNDLSVSDCLQSLKK